MGPDALLNYFTTEGSTIQKDSIDLDYEDGDDPEVEDF